MKKILCAALAALGLATGAGAQTVCPSTALTCDVNVSISLPPPGSSDCSVQVPPVVVQARTSPLVIRWNLVPTTPGTEFRLGTVADDGIAFTGTGQTWFRDDGPQRQQKVVRKLLRARTAGTARENFPYYIRAEHGPLGSAQACTSAGPSVIGRD